MASNLPEASLPSDDIATPFQARFSQLRLPLTREQIIEEIWRFEEYLTTVSEVLLFRGITSVGFRTSVFYLSPDQSSAISPPAGQMIMVTAIENAVGAETQSDPAELVTEPPASLRLDHDAGAQTTDVPRVNPIATTITENEIETEDTGGDALGSPAPTAPRSQCKICMDELAPETTIVINCGCTYCGTCLNDHIMHGLTSRADYPARCCGAEGIDMGNASPYLSLEVLLRWSEVEAEYKEHLPMYCQNKQCSAHIPEGRLGGESKFIDCSYCHTDTCKECKQWRFEHSGEDMEVCPEDIVSKEDRELANSEKWVQCPGCKNLVERTDGCNNMLCECGTEFCYDCGVEYSSDHSCGCQTRPDEDGWHHREREMPEDLADHLRNPFDEDHIELLGLILFRAGRDGHGPFANAGDATNWLLEHEGGDEEGNGVITWQSTLGEQSEETFGSLEDEAEALVFQVYERLILESLFEAAEEDTEEATAAASTW